MYLLSRDHFTILTLCILFVWYISLKTWDVFVKHFNALSGKRSKTGIFIKEAIEFHGYTMIWIWIPYCIFSKSNYHSLRINEPKTWCPKILNSRSKTSREMHNSYTCNICKYNNFGRNKNCWITTQRLSHPVVLQKQVGRSELNCQQHTLFNNHHQDLFRQRPF